MTFQISGVNLAMETESGLMGEVEGEPLSPVQGVVPVVAARVVLEQFNMTATHIERCGGEQVKHIDTLES